MRTLWFNAWKYPSEETVLAGLLGVGYLGVQVLYIQQLQLLLGSPVRSFVGVLVVMLLCSGLGAWVSTGLTPRVRNRLLFLLPVALVAEAAATGALTERAVALSPVAGALAALAIVAPCAFAMGIPLPVLIREVRARHGHAMGALLFAWNGALSAVGTLAGLYAVSTWGFRQTFLLAALIYLSVAGLAWATSRRSRER